MLAVSDGLPPRDVAPTWELLGDLNEGDEKWEAALESFHTAHEIDASRVKCGAQSLRHLTLRMADMKAESRLAEAMLRGENITDLDGK